MSLQTFLWVNAPQSWDHKINQHVFVFWLSKSFFCWNWRALIQTLHLMVSEMMSDTFWWLTNPVSTIKLPDKQPWIITIKHVSNALGDNDGVFTPPHPELCAWWYKALRDLFSNGNSFYESLYTLIFSWSEGYCSRKLVICTPDVAQHLLIPLFDLLYLYGLGPLPSYAIPLISHIPPGFRLGFLPLSLI